MGEIMCVGDMMCVGGYDGCVDMMCGGYDMCGI